MSAATAVSAPAGALREIALGEEDREAEHDERQRVTGAPPRAQARGGTPSRAPGPTPRGS